MKQFDSKNIQLLGFSCDTVFSLKVWALAMGGIGYPLLSDFNPHGKVSQELGIYGPEMGAPKRSIIVIDPQGVVRAKRFYPSGLPVPDEVLAEVVALQSS